MNFDMKFRIAMIAVSATLSLAATLLAAHGIVLSPLDDPIGVGPH